MSMTPRQRVIAAVHHQQPDRVPFSWGFGATPEMTEDLQAYLAGLGIDWSRLRAAVEDINYLPLGYAGPQLPAGTDLWGIRRKHVNYGEGSYDEIAYYPLAGVEDPAQLDDYPWPDPELYAYDTLREATQTADPTMQRAKKYFGGNPFEIYCWMTGLEEAMMNLLVAPDVVTAALDKITTYFETRMVKALVQAGDLVDLVFLADDLGGQQGLLLLRDNYREILQPFHQRLTATAHRLAPQAKIMFHSDGAVFDILPDLLDAGIDLLEAVQTDAAGMDPVRLKSTFANRLGFHGAISVQSLLPHHDEETVEAECRRLVEILGAGGGYIAAPSHAIQVGTPPQNVLAMLRGVLGEEDYLTAVAQAREQVTA
ncbi:MAG: uroporphyrinogen decarboxylase family protein [Armatimonadota bacterium]